MKNSISRKSAVWIVVVTLTLISIIFFGFIYNTGKSFTKRDWLKDKDGRHYMATDLIRSKILIGKDSNEVKQLLGHPFSRSDSTYQPGFRNDWFYEMGGGSFGLGFGLHILIVKFDNTRVVSVKREKIRA